MLMGALATGCATTESKVRVISRAGAVRDVRLLPVVDDAVPMQIGAGADILTDDELADLQARLPQTLKGTIAHLPGDRVGTLKAIRITVKGSAGRETHRFIAECRLRVRLPDGQQAVAPQEPRQRGDVIADVEGSAIRLVQARNLSVVELRSIEADMQANGGRITLLSFEDVEAVVVDACQAALVAIVDENFPGDSDDGTTGFEEAREARRLEREARRRRALDHLRTEAAREAPRADRLAAALVDIGDSGHLDDAQTVGAWLYDDNALVRRAAESSFGALCAGAAVFKGTEIACARPAPPPPPPPPPTPALHDPDDPDDTDDDVDDVDEVDEVNGDDDTPPRTVPVPNGPVPTPSPASTPVPTNAGAPDASVTPPASPDDETSTSTSTSTTSTTSTTTPGEAG